MIDLHTHTFASDGTYSPKELIAAAGQLGLEAIAITDHDTLEGYDAARPFAEAAGFDLLCGVELSGRLAIASSGKTISRTVHLLGYFPSGPAPANFRAWIQEIQDGRRERNLRLVQRLRDAGVAIELREVEALGHSLAGRPHFARLLVEKGYALDTEDAFRQYLDESAASYVERQAPDLATSIQQVLEGGGVPVMAHPVRLNIRDRADEVRYIEAARELGLRGLEAYHSDHSAADVERYLEVARQLGLVVTGGSDFHGAAKPLIQLGSGRDGNVRVPRSVLDGLRSAQLAWRT